VTTTNASLSAHSGRSQVNNSHCFREWNLANILTATHLTNACLASVSAVSQLVPDAPNDTDSLHISHLFACQV